LIGVVKAFIWISFNQRNPGRFIRSESEITTCDPKDGELCLIRLKPGETLVEGLVMVLTCKLFVGIE